MKETKIVMNPCITEVYWKDVKHLKPSALNNNRVNYRFNCTFILTMWLKEVLSGLKNFFYEGTLHGVKYIFEPSFSKKERWTWVFIVGISIGFCVGNINQLFSKWRSSPFVNVMDSLPTPVWAVPFPSVVLCPQLHIKLSMANVTNMDKISKSFASLICPQMFKMRNTLLIKRLNRTEQKRLQDFILEASPKCSDVVKKCYWGTADDANWAGDHCCQNVFRPVFTNYGLCYGFNTLPLNGMSNVTLPWHKTFDSRPEDYSQSWTLDDGYPQNFSINDHPYRAMAAGEQYGFGADLFLNSSEHQFECDGSSKGFTILISSPTDHVYTSTVVRLPMDRMTSIEISPLTYKTDATLRSLHAEQRQCYFQNEKKLHYYGVYTDSNCKHDLIIKEVKKICNCVAYNWPRGSLNDNICITKEDFQCLNSVKDDVEKTLIMAYFAEGEDTRGHGISTCYPSCNDIIYSSQVFYSDLRRDPGLNDSNSNWGDITRVNIHFYKDMFLGLHRHAQYDDYYFVGAIGGLLSLFLGFSIISLAEMVFFVILRPLQAVFGYVVFQYQMHTHRN